MIPGVAFRFRDMLKPPLVPVWLSDRSTGTPGLNVGYRVLWMLAGILDAGQDLVVQGVQAQYPGLGTPTALPYIGRTRGILQGLTEANDHYAARLVQWLETHADARTKQIAVQLHEYLPNNPRVRIIERRAPSSFFLPPRTFWTTVDLDGSVSTAVAPWNWDGTSNPARHNNWSEIFIVVQPDPFGARPGLLGGLVGDDGLGLGHLVPHAISDTARKIIRDWRGAHSYVRCVLWCSDMTAYDPHNLAALRPNGNWGQWSTPLSDPRVASDRDTTVTRYWDFPEPPS